MLATLLFLAFLSVCTATFQPLGVPFKSPVTTAAGFTAQVIFSNLTLPRGIAFDDQNNLLVVERGVGVTAFSRNTVSSVAGWERTVVIADPGFTHGIEIDGSSLFVSTAGEVRQYKYDASTKSVSGSPKVVVTDLPADGELTTHTLLLDKRGSTTYILVGSGPLTNIDPSARDPASGRSQVRRFLIRPPTTSPLPIVPPSWLSGELIAYGIRNPAGFAFSPDPTLASLATGPPLYIAENGATIDGITGITSTFANDNPADELEVVSVPATSVGRPSFFGFPDCTTLWNPKADPIGDPQYTSLQRGDQISLQLTYERDDKWCQEKDNNVPPVLSFQAHSVPLDIKFYVPGTTAGIGSFPSTYARDAFVSFHGSFNRNPPVGYGVIRVPFPLSSPSLETANPFIVQAANLATCPGTCIRPVGLAFGKDGRLYVSSDSSGELFVVYRSFVTLPTDLPTQTIPEPPTPTPVPS